MTLSLLRRVSGITSAIVMAATATLAAQQYNVKGVVIDSTKTAKQGAMVVALNRLDSTIVTFATTGSTGRFDLARLKPGNYILQVTAIGFKPVKRNFTIGNASIAADTVVMIAAPYKLGELVATAEHVPIVNKPDTLEYNAEAFKTRANAPVEELLKRLPGMTVDADGTIKAQGQTVQKVLVDGKEFFGNDPKMATKNLAAAAIDKVQVLDKKSDAAEFSGIDDGNQQKTINLVLKPNARVGYFGRSSAGVGPAPGVEGAFAGSKGDNARYTGALNLNRFSPTTQLSMIGSRNNVGNSGFSLGTVSDVGRGVSGGSSGGFSETMALGLNGSQQFGKDSWLRGSYFLSTSDNRRQSVTDEQLLQGASVSANRNETANSNSNSTSHRLNLNAQRSFSTWSQLRFRGNFFGGPSNSDNVSQQETLTPSGAFQNSATSAVATDATNLGGDGRVTYSRRFNQAGRTLVAEAWGDLSKPRQLSTVNSSTDFTDGIGGIITRDVFQSQRRNSRTFTTGQRLGLTNPLGKGAVLELFGQHRAISETQNYLVNDIIGGTQVPNTDLSQAFDRTYSYLNGGTRLSRNTKTLRWVLGLEAQKSDLQGKIINRNEQISNGFTNLLPSANMRYQINTGSNFQINYRTSTREPSLNELQPFVDNTNPLRIYAGNPDLTPQYQHSLRTEFRRFDQFSFRSIYFFANVGYNRNQIVNSRDIDLQGRQTVKPINLGDGWNSNLGGSYGSPIRALGLQLDVDYSYNRSRGSELLNQVENISHTANHSAGVRLQNRSKEIFDLSAGAQFDFNNVKYSINTALNQNYVNKNFNASGTWYASQAVSANVNANYLVYDQNIFGPRDNPFMLGASLGYQFMDNRAELRISGSDLLNQNNGFSISSSSSSIREVRSAT
ncbi:MAG: TonB-dependent receptor, partial [Gemmatimonadales bacterium]